MLRTIIVDDDEIVTFLQKKIVSKCELDPDPISFKDAGEALRFLSQDSDPEVSYLIMLDINMPIMSGWQFLEEIKNVPDNDRFHVVMVTSSIDRKDKRDAANDPHVIDFYRKTCFSKALCKIKRYL